MSSLVGRSWPGVQGRCTERGWRPVLPFSTTCTRHANLGGAVWRLFFFLKLSKGDRRQVGVQSPFTITRMRQASWEEWCSTIEVVIRDRTTKGADPRTVHGPRRVPLSSMRHASFNGVPPWQSVLLLWSRSLRQHKRSTGLQCGLECGP